MNREKVMFRWSNCDRKWLGQGPQLNHRDVCREFIIPSFIFKGDIFILDKKYI